MSTPSPLEVNTYTVGDQIEPRVAGLDDGSWMVAWSSEYRPPNSFDALNWDVFLKFYKEDGTGITEVRLDTDPDHGKEALLNTCTLANGTYLVTWAEYEGTSSQDYTTFMRRYDGSGVALGEAVDLGTNSADATFDYHTSIAASGGGWYSLIAQTNASDSAVNTEFVTFDETGAIISSFTLSGSWDNDTTATIAELADGRIVSYHLDQVTASATGLKLFDSDGSDMSGTIAVPVQVSSPKILALDDGGFLLSGVNAGKLYFQRYDSDGALMFSKAATFDILNSDRPEQWSVVALENGNFVACIIERGNSQLSLRTYDSSGTLLTIDDNEISNSNAVSATALEDGGWVYTANSWDSNVTTQSQWNVVQQRFDADGNAIFTYDVAPQSENRSFPILEDMSYTFSTADFPFSDAGEENSLHDDFAGITVTTLPTSGNLTLDGMLLAAGDKISADDIGKLVFTPATNAFGKHYGDFQFKIRDSGSANAGGSNTSDTYSFRIDVQAVVDTFTGTSGPETIVGTDDRDILIGKKGRDILEGGTGADTFVFRNGDGKDTITDFTATGSSHDVLDLSAISDVDSFRDLKRDHLQAQGDDTWIVFNNRNHVVLENVDVADLGKRDFLL